jgi:hypothetical protein
MFGHDNSDQHKEDDSIMSAPMPPDAALTDTPTDDSSSPVVSAPSMPFASSDTDTPVPSTNDADNSDISFGAVPSTPASPGADDLLNIKQQALKQLSPLVGHLDQTPEEKFRTTMMMIQGSDDQSLIKDAYAAAQQISDEKAKAQALLDIVNEINYFTQHSNA